MQSVYFELFLSRVWGGKVLRHKTKFASLTALFTNMWTLKFKSGLHNCVFRCCQSYLWSQAINLETRKHKMDRNPLITNHKPWPFEPVKVRGLLRWSTAAKNAIVSWLLNFRIHMFVKSAVTAAQRLRKNKTNMASLFRNIPPKTLLTFCWSSLCKKFGYCRSNIYERRQC